MTTPNGARRSTLIESRVNNKIRAINVRLIGETGVQLGVVALDEALKVAAAAGLDLIEVSPDAVPPVCKVGNWSKMKYEQSLRDKANRRNSTKNTTKEIKVRPRIGEHDLAVKVAHIRQFLEHGDKVRVVVMFRGRENARPEVGIDLLNRIASDLLDVGQIVGKPLHQGRDAHLMLAPL